MMHPIINGFVYKSNYPALTWFIFKSINKKSIRQSIAEFFIF